MQANEVFRKDHQIILFKGCAESANGVQTHLDALLEPSLIYTWLNHGSINTVNWTLDGTRPVSLGEVVDIATNNHWLVDLQLFNV